MENEIGDGSEKLFSPSAARLLAITVGADKLGEEERCLDEVLCT